VHASSAWVVAEAGQDSGDAVAAAVNRSAMRVRAPGWPLRIPCSHSPVHDPVDLIAKSLPSNRWQCSRMLVTLWMLFVVGR
jgi:hypothetical protein